MDRFFLCCALGLISLNLVACDASKPSHDDTQVKALSLAGASELPPMGDRDGQMTAYQTPAERSAAKGDEFDVRGDYSALFGITPADTQPVRALAEWESADGVLVGWSDQLAPFFVELAAALDESTIIYMLSPDLRTSESLRDYLANNGVDPQRLAFFEYAHEAFWTRDFGPITVTRQDGSLAFVDMRYYQNRRRDDAVPTLLGRYFNVPVLRPNMHSEGGNFMTNGAGLCVMTSWLLEANPMFSEEEMRGQLRDYFGCQQNVILQRLGGEGTGHIDMFAKFTKDDTILLGRYESRDDPINAELLERHAATLSQVTLADGRPLKVVRIPMPAPTHPVYRSYTNSLMVNGALIMPTYKGFEAMEQEALNAYREALPAGTPIRLVDSSDVIEWGGAVHCTTKLINFRALSAETPATDVTVEPQPSTSAHFGVTPEQSLPDQAVVESVLEVPANSGVERIGVLSLDVSISHTYVGDLSLILSHNGKEELIFVGDGPGRDLKQRFETSAFAGSSPEGLWTLRVSDRAAEDVGTLWSWSLTFNPAGG